MNFVGPVRLCTRSCCILICAFLQWPSASFAATSQLVATYSGTNQFERFGQSLAPIGSEVLIGATRWRSDGFVGAVLPRDLATSIPAQPIPNPALVDDSFGQSLAHQNGTLAVGAFRRDQAGAVELIDLSTQSPIRTIPNPNPANDAQFGWSVAIVGDRLVVGVPGHDIGAATQAGRIDIFDLASGTFERSISNPVTLDNRFGEDLIPLDGRRVLVGSIWTGGQLPGHVRIYDVQTGQMLREITPPPQMGPSGFGAGLAVAHGNIYVGSYEGVPIPPAANFGGSVNVYDAESGDYRRSFGRVLPIQGDNFGNSIGVVGPNLAVRSFLVDRNSSPDGAVHIVDATSGDVLDSIPNPQPFVIQTTTEFGDSMVGVGSRLVITNPTYAPPGGDPFAHGGVFVYENLPRMTAYSHFDEPADGAANHTRGPGQTEASFTTTTTPTGGANPLAGVETSIERRFGRSLVHRSQNATTTFQTLDLTGWHEAAVSFYLAVDATEYEAGDFLRATITNGAQTLTLVDLFGGDASAPLNLIADEQIRRYQFDIPDDWSQVSLALSSSTNSSTGAERIDFDYVLIQAVPDPAVAAFTTAVPPATADVVFDMAQGDRVRTGLNLTGPYSLGYLAHTGEADGQLRAWFEVDGLAPEELATLAIDLEFAADIVEAHVITGGPTLPTANLMLIFAAGATPGQQGAVTLNFGPSAITQAIAIPEPSTLALAAAALALFAARTRLRRQT